MRELSVIIPTYNGAARLRRCLESFGRQTLPAERFEVVVVLDGSTDETARMLADSDTPFALAVIEQRNQGAAAARNAGAAAARGRYCVFVDDDIVASPELLAEHLRVQRDRRGVAGLGAIPTVVAADAGWLPRRVAEDFNAHYARLASGARAPSWRVCYGGNLSVPRAAFRAVGGFACDMRRGHDVELGYRLAEYGLEFAYIAGAAGTQELSKRGRALYSDFEHYGVAAVEIFRRHPQTLPEVIPDFGAPGAGPVWLRRLLLATEIPPHVIGTVVGALADEERWSRAWYRLVHHYCYWRGVRRALADPGSWWQLTHGTPVLVYRALGAAGQPVERDRVPLAHFARQLAWLKRAGYRVLGLEQYRQFRREHRLPPRRSVVIVLGDGCADSCSLADPVLRRHGYSAAALLAGGDVSGEDATVVIPPSRSGVNNHRTPPQVLQPTEIHGTDSLVRFAWKVARASGSLPQPGARSSFLHLVRRRSLQVAR